MKGNDSEALLPPIQNNQDCQAYLKSNANNGEKNFSRDGTKEQPPIPLE